MTTSKENIDTNNHNNVITANLRNPVEVFAAEKVPESSTETRHPEDHINIPQWFNISDIFYDPATGDKLYQDNDSLVTTNGINRWSIIRGIPRFVADDLYVDSFSFEWNTHNTTQLDFKTGSNSSEEMFKTKTGLDADQVRGKLVLDAGVGAGRFTDILSRWGANVVGVDLSFAVEASYTNFKDRPNVIIAQADIGKLPFAPGTFDYIVSIGVLHHTPDTKSYFNKLVPLLKPGGEICIWLYPAQGDYVKRAAWIPFTHRIPDKMFYSWCRVFVPFAQRHMSNPIIQFISRVFPFSNQGLGLENDILDTFDGYSPRYHEIHNPDEIVKWFEEAGLVNIQVLPWDTAVRGQLPAS